MIITHQKKTSKQNVVCRNYIFNYIIQVYRSLQLLGSPFLQGHLSDSKMTASI